MAIPTSLQGQVRHQINSIDVVEATSLKVHKEQPLTRKVGAIGYIGTAKGVPTTNISLTFAQPADRSQFEAFAMAQEGPEGFSYTFFKGTAIFLVPYCYAGSADFSNDPASGNTETTLEIQGGTAVQLQ